MGILEIREIAKDFGQLPVLSDVSFSVEEGEIVSIVGRSGCGKTTLLKIIAGLVESSVGRIEVGSRGTIGYVPQNLALVPWLNVFENLIFPFSFNGKKAPNDDKVEEVLNLVGLWEFRNYSIRQLSGGMQQKLAVARALAVSSDIILMDEPFRALDEIGRFQLNLELLRIWDKTKVTIVLVTHSIAEAVFLSDKVLLMSGRPASIKGSFEIEIGYPRNQHTLDETGFQDTVKEIRSSLI